VLKNVLRKLDKILSLFIKSVFFTCFYSLNLNIKTLIKSANFLKKYQKFENKSNKKLTFKKKLFYFHSSFVKTAYSKSFTLLTWIKTIEILKFHLFGLLIAIELMYLIQKIQISPKIK
jgi:hypothetical protein